MRIDNFISRKLSDISPTYKDLNKKMEKTPKWLKAAGIGVTVVGVGAGCFAQDQSSASIPNTSGEGNTSPSPETSPAQITAEAPLLTETPSGRVAIEVNEMPEPEIMRSFGPVYDLFKENTVIHDILGAPETIQYDANGVVVDYENGADRAFVFFTAINKEGDNGISAIVIQNKEGKTGFAVLNWITDTDGTRALAVTHDELGNELSKPIVVYDTNLIPKQLEGMTDKEIASFKGDLVIAGGIQMPLDDILGKKVDASPINVAARTATPEPTLEPTPEVVISFTQEELNTMSDEQKIAAAKEIEGLSKSNVSKYSSELVLYRDESGTVTKVFNLLTGEILLAEDTRVSEFLMVDGQRFEVQRFDDAQQAIEFAYTERGAKETTRELSIHIEQIKDVHKILGINGSNFPQSLERSYLSGYEVLIDKDNRNNPAFGVFVMNLSVGTLIEYYNSDLNRFEYLFIDGVDANIVANQIGTGDINVGQK